MTNLPTVICTTDMTESELAKVQQFVDDGLPGISNVTDDKLHKMLDLYLNGSTYTQISAMLAVKRVHVLYLAHSAQWYQLKQDYLNEVQEKIKSRVVDSKLRSQEFMLLLVQAYQKRIGNNLTRYLSTNDTQHINDVSLKELAQLMKAIEMVNNLDETGKDKNTGKAPTVGLNIGSGVLVEKTGDNQVSITPKESSFGDLLQKLADERRNKENSLVDPNIGEKK